jgi:hypothetical protein
MFKLTCLLATTSLALMTSTAIAQEPLARASQPNSTIAASSSLALNQTLSHTSSSTSLIQAEPTIVAANRFTVAQASRSREQVRRQLVQATQVFERAGFRATHNLVTGYLGNGGDENITLTLRQGMTYAIVGVCDNDCRDVDLRLYDDNGNLVTSDVQTGDIPVLKVAPRWTGRYQIKVVMARCSNAPCHYGVAAFGK